MNSLPQIRTNYRLEKETKEAQIYEEYTKLMKEPGAMATAVQQALMTKYRIHAKSTIWNICRRAKERSQPTQ